MQTNRRAIENYILAKDGNRADLLRQAFLAEAKVAMTVHTNAISFPSDLDGLPAITSTLVRRFNQTYENIYTFCIGEPPAAGALAHDCTWLVGMSDKETGDVRVGCGEYNWQFDPGSGLISHLEIVIERMQISPAAQLEPVMDWVRGLSYPWCQASEAITHAPKLASIAAVIDYLQRYQSQVLAT